METLILLIKMDIAHFGTGKPGNLNSLREVIWIILWQCCLEIDWREESVPKKSVIIINILQMKCIYRACPWSSWTIPADIVVETWVKNCTARFYNHSIGMRSYLIKNKFKFNLQKHHFEYVYEVNNQVLCKCYYLLIFSPCFN